MASDLEQAREHSEAGRYAEAWRIVSPHLQAEPNDPRGLALAAFMLEKQGNAALAYHVCKQLTQAHPQQAIAWLNLGKCCDTLWRMSEAEAAYTRALTQVRAGDNATKIAVLCNIAALHLQMGNFKRAREYSERVLKIDPDHLKSRHNMGLCLMAAGEWAEGWKQYEASVGSPQRIAWNYGGEPTWQGEPGKTVAIFGEQGIGDEICAASMVPDAIKRAGKVIIDCDSRLESLFRRSFPDARVYGTRNQKVLNWAEEDHQVDYSIAAMQLGALFRPDAESFTRQPYLKADPDAVLMWKALWKSKGKPAVGVAWTGGLAETGQSLRSLTTDQLGPLFGIDAHFVSLQYKETDTTGTPLHTYAHATLTKDYDMTAGLVASLDAVVSVPTSVAHLSGALGVPTIAMQAQASCWKYAAGLPFHPCNLIPNNGKWADTLYAAASQLKKVLYD